MSYFTTGDNRVCDIMASVQVVSSYNDQSVIDCLKQGGVVIALTDTIYGILALANNQAAVERVFSVKSRHPDKSPIVLVSHQDQLYDQPSQPLAELMDEKWPGPVSIIVPSQRAPVWLRRSNNSLAYRQPAHRELAKLIDEVGPLIAPSANPEGQPPAMTIEAAIEYFADAVDIYIDSGPAKSCQPSQLLQVESNGEVERLR